MKSGDICKLPRCISCCEKLTLSKSIILYPRLDELLPIYRFLWSQSSQYINQLKQHHQQQSENRPDARAGVQCFHPQGYRGGDDGAALFPLAQLLHCPESRHNLAGETLQYRVITVITRPADGSQSPSRYNDLTCLTSKPVKILGCSLVAGQTLSLGAWRPYRTSWIDIFVAGGHSMWRTSPSQEAV